MFWVILIVVIMIVAACLDSTQGKIVVGAGVIALGLLLLSWITGVGFFITLAKVCAVVIVVVLVGSIVLDIIGN